MYRQSRNLRLEAYTTQQHKREEKPIETNNMGGTLRVLLIQISSHKNSVSGNYLSQTICFSQLRLHKWELDVKSTVTISPMGE